MKGNIFDLILSNSVIVLALCFVTFTVLDWYNPLMNFTANAVSSKLLVLYCILSILLSVKTIRGKGTKTQRKHR